MTGEPDTGGNSGGGRPDADRRAAEEPDGMLRSVRQRRSRYQTWLREGEPSLGRYLAQVGVLGWAIVVPTLLGVFLGRWVDQQLGTGIFWTGPLLLLGLGLGCWSACKWMHGT